MAYSVAIIEHSIYPNGQDVITMEIEFPRYVLAEFNTHRVISKNAASSRAIPNHKMREWTRSNMFVPFHIGKKRKGMQSGKQIERVNLAQFIWKTTAYINIGAAWLLDKLGSHKQVSNRLLEPFSYIKVLITSNDLHNFFHLRCHKDAAPEIQKIARMMARAYRDSTPKRLNYGEWHLPYISDDEKLQYTNGELLKFSAARCARVSYKTFDGKPANPKDDINTFDKLINGERIHSSPCEHQAIAYHNHHDYSNNFVGLFQYRGLLKNHTCHKFDFDSLTDEDFVL